MKTLTVLQSFKVHYALKTFIFLLASTQVHSRSCSVGSKYRVWSEDPKKSYRSLPSAEVAKVNLLSYQGAVREFDLDFFKKAGILVDCSDAAAFIKMIEARRNKRPFQLIQNGIRVGNDGASHDWALNYAGIPSLRAYIEGGPKSRLPDEKLDLLWQYDPISAYRRDQKFQRFVHVVRNFVAPMMAFGFSVALEDAGPGDMIADATHTSTVIGKGGAPGSSVKVAETFSDLGAKSLEASYNSPRKLRLGPYGHARSGIFRWRTPIKWGTSSDGHGCWEYRPVQEEHGYSLAGYTWSGTPISKRANQVFSEGYRRDLLGQQREFELAGMSRSDAKEESLNALIRKAAHNIFVDVNKRAGMVKKGYENNVRGRGSFYYGATSTHSTDKKIHKMFRSLDLFINGLARDSRFGPAVSSKGRAFLARLLKETSICVTGRNGQQHKVVLADLKGALANSFKRTYMAEPWFSPALRWGHSWNTKLPSCDGRHQKPMTTRNNFDVSIMKSTQRKI